MVLEVNGWKLLYHPVFGDRYAQLRARARELKASLPPGEFTKHPDVKLVAAVRRVILEIIPEDPNRPDFWLGADLAAFRRVKGYGLPDRYRLYYVFTSSALTDVAGNALSPGASPSPSAESAVRCDTMSYMPMRPYSLRLGPSTIRRLSEEAGRLRVPARTLAQELVDEGLRMRRHLIIRFVERAAGRRASVAHRPRLTVAAVVETVQDSTGLAEAAESLELSVTDLERVLDYYAEFRDEVDAEIAGRLEVAEREERLFRERERLLARSR